MTDAKKFISYKSEEREIAKRICDAVRSWGYITWFDQDDIPKGEYFRNFIQQGLETSDVVIGVLTAKALESREVITEWDYAFSGKARLILMRYEPVELPYWLAGVQHIDCTTNEETALEQLRQALSGPDPSKHEKPSPPKHIKRHTSYEAQLYIPPENSPDDLRDQMLLNVYNTWIKGVLHPNLPDGQIDVDLDLKPEAVLHHVDYPDYDLTDTQQDIGQIFTDMKGELLILGDPGSGKTIMLLQLAERLLGQAQHDHKKPMPVVFNLASWGRDRVMGSG